MYDSLELQLEQSKKELLESFFTTKKLQERIDRLEGENGSYKENHDQLTNDFNDRKDKYENIIELQTNQIEKLKNEIQKMDYECEKAKKNLEDMKEETENILQEQKDTFDKEKSDLKDKIQKLESRLETIDIFIKNKEDLENERKYLKEQLEFEKKEKIRELADKDREKILLNDNLKKEMLHKIHETKNSLLALKQDQLQTTTRLTILQNHQLTVELEYQSKQSEKLLIQNKKLLEQVSALKRDVDIHKEVEQELAKRSHFCQQLIKKLNLRIKDLEDENGKQKLNQEDFLPELSKLHEKEDRKKDEILSSLERHLKTLETKLAKVQNDCEILKNENFYLQAKIDTNDIKYSNLADIISTNLENLKNNQSSVLEDILDKESDANIIIDINELRHKQVHEWNIQEKEGILNILLSQIRPLMSKKNMMQPLKNSQYNQSVNVTLVEQSQYGQSKDNTSNISLPKRNLSLNQGINKSMDQRDASFDSCLTGRGLLNNSINSSFNRFQEVPLIISTKIVKSPLRQWGKTSSTLPSSNHKNKNRKLVVS